MFHTDAVVWCKSNFWELSRGKKICKCVLFLSLFYTCLPKRDFNVSNFYLFIKQEKCLYPGSCLGAPNPSLAKQYMDGTTDYALLDSNEECNSVLGFHNKSRLCKFWWWCGGYDSRFLLF